MSTTRRTASFTLTTEEGFRRTYTILSDITVDDLVRISMKAYVHEKKFGTEYASPFSREVRDAVVRTRVTNRG